MVVSIERDRLIRMLRTAASRVREQREELGRLDSFGGDGDHGATMARAMDRMEEALDENPEAAAGDLFDKVGWAIMGADGGATGPLLGSFFMSMSTGLESDTLDAKGLAGAFDAGFLGFQANTKARAGDKTMVDALEPAVRAFREAAESGEDVVTALREAARAAQEGALATRDMQARFGRAKNIGDKSVGHEDPGAVSISLVFKGLFEGASADG